MQHKIWPADECLFNEMKVKYSLPNEQHFFDFLKRKQTDELSFSWENLVLSSENEENLYFSRVDYDEYILGKDNIQGKSVLEVHLIYF